MPIAPELKHLYGHHWRTVIRPRILKRCGGRCERCGRVPDRIEVAHLDGDATNRTDENLAGLCSTCHKRHDYPQWAAKALETRRARKDRCRPLLSQE
jgi:5-methylcytosine-specific restriction endonuclease McrA